MRYINLRFTYFLLTVWEKFQKTVGGGFFGLTLYSRHQNSLAHAIVKAD